MRSIILAALALILVPSASALCGVAACVDLTTAYANGAAADALAHGTAQSARAINATNDAILSTLSAANCAIAGNVGCANAQLNGAIGRSQTATFTMVGSANTYALGLAGDTYAYAFSLLA